MTTRFEVKHVNEKTRQRFAATCKLLGIQQNEGLEQALNDWFKKHNKPSN